MADDGGKSTYFPGNTDGGNVTASFVLDPFNGRYRVPKPSGKEGACGPCGEGGGDVAWRELETALDVLRYASGFFNIQRTAGGDLFIAQTGNNPLVLWNNGVQENADPTGLLPAGSTLTRAETDGYKEGAIAANQSQNFRAVGLSLEVEMPFLTGTIGTDTNARFYLDQFTEYAEWLVRAVATAGHLRFRYGGTQLGYEMGRMCFWPSMSGKVGQLGAQFGRPLAGAFVPLRIPTFSGTSLDENQLECEIHLDRSVQVNAIAAAPIPALAVGTNYLLPITAQLIGEPVPSGNVQSIDGVKSAAKSEISAMLTKAAAAAGGDPARFMAALASLAAE